MLNVKPIKNDLGPFYVWEEPVPGNEYVIGVDVAEGKMPAGFKDPTGEKRDWSVATVVEIKNGSLVCQYKSQIDVYNLAYDLMMLGYWYNEGLLAIELNSVGIGVVHLVREAGYRNLYQPVTPDNFGSTIKPVYMIDRLYGWRTTPATRPLIIASIHEALANNYSIPSRSLLNEMLSMVYTERGRIEAASGKHDDEVMSYGIALVVRNEVLQLGKGQVSIENDIPGDEKAGWKNINKFIDQLKEKKNEPEFW